MITRRGGPVNVDLDAATRHGVIVSYTPGRNAVATAEHSVAMIMAAARQIAQRDAELKAGQWRSDYYNYDAVGPEISGKTAGVCGYGAVGSRVAKILQAMGAHVVVYDPWIDASKLEPGMEYVPELEQLLDRADILLEDVGDDPHRRQIGDLIQRLTGIKLHALGNILGHHDAIARGLQRQGALNLPSRS